MLILLFIILAVNASGSISITGRRLELFSHPLMVRLRHAGGGAMGALGLADIPLDRIGLVGWVAIAATLVGSARRFVTPDPTSTSVAPQNFTRAKS